MFNYLNLSFFNNCDTPRPWGLYFQDSATPQMEGLVELHDNIMFYLVIILFGVGWIMISIVRNYSHLKSPISHKYLNHGTLIELIWTITPALILIFIAFPSFKLLYLMDEVSDPAMTVLAEGHQWYWSYQYPDVFLNGDDEFIEFDSYLVPEFDLEDGALRMLEVDNWVILLELTHVRLIGTAADVTHSFACPFLGIKCDAYPGWLNGYGEFIEFEASLVHEFILDEGFVNTMDISRLLNPVTPQALVPGSGLESTINSVIQKLEAQLEWKRINIPYSTASIYSDKFFGSNAINSLEHDILKENLISKNLGYVEKLNEAGEPSMYKSELSTKALTSTKSLITVLKR